MYDHITSLENLYNAWGEFIQGKQNKKDVCSFARFLDINIFNLHQDLKSKTYCHGGYKAFKINDPKPRDIHKASVRDRLIHHAIYRILYLYFDRKFIHDSYSCRSNKGTHKAIQRFEHFTRKVSKNHTKQCYILKCDIKKFFANIDHQILKNILQKHIKDTETINLLLNIIESFHTTFLLSRTSGKENLSARQDLTEGKGLPLGNLTSQLLVNIYMNEFDQFVKHKLKIKYYVRYADDFVFISQDKEYLKNFIPILKEFLKNTLNLEIHPKKVYIKTIYSGIDFLGWVHFSKHRILRNATKRRMFRILKENNFKQESVGSYLGMLKWGNGYKIRKQIQI